MICVDGLAGFYMDDPKAEMPNIRALAKDGAGGQRDEGFGADGHVAEPYDAGDGQQPGPTRRGRRRFGTQSIPHVEFDALRAARCPAAAFDEFAGGVEELQRQG